MTERLASLSRTGRYVAARSRHGVTVVDALGTSPRRELHGAVVDFACVGTALWVLVGEQIDRYALATGKPIAPAIALPRASTALVVDRCAKLDAAVACGAPPVLALADGPLAIDDGVVVAFPLGGRRVATVDVDRVLRIVELGRRDPVIATLRFAGDVIAVHALFGGKMIAVVERAGDRDWWNVLRHDGTRAARIATPRATCFSVACEKGAALVVLDDGARWEWIDLRYGARRVGGETPFAAATADVSSDGRYAVFAGPGAGDEACVAHLPVVELLSKGSRAAPSEEVETDDVADAGDVVDDGAAIEVIDATVEVDASDEKTAADDSPATATPPPSPAVDLEAVVPLALGAPPAALGAVEATSWPAYASAREHFDDMLDLVAARAARAIADGWNTGRLAMTGDRGVAAEVCGLLGVTTDLAPDALAHADTVLADAVARNAGRVRTTLAAGLRLPFVELMRELDLSPIAGHVLMIAIAAVERGEIARLFRILSDDERRPLVDRYLIETILGDGDRARRAAIASELADGAPLRRFGAIHVAGDDATAALSVDPIVIERCRDLARVRARVRPLSALCLGGDAARALVDAVTRSRAAGDPLRLVIRGRRGSGRRSAIAALAARVDRSLADIDCARLPRAGSAMAAALRDELRRAVLRGCVPLISGLELADPSDGEGHDRIRQVVRAHAGPIIVRTTPESFLPIDPGAVTVALPSLSEGERAVFWRAALARAGIVEPDVDRIAARWRIAPGQIEHVIEQVVSRGGGSIDEAARQHIATRLAHVATPVRRLAAWEQVALADDMIDSIREFIGRAAHRKTVLDDWGFDAKLTSARGLTALFYGPPGTGKSMVAGLIARELGLELYRVDLSRVVSKWIGETEKNLAEVFDAAEDGQVVILFDEADSLFAKRTEVKTSNDRYANLEVNYLLQRLDSFEGIAILTTNLDGSIDPAFKRRMSMRLQFPFPDEEMRKRLWAAHIPAATPTASDFDFDALARRFPLSGGYIRNSVLRAAFIAAQERRPLRHDHLTRAIALEYRELGKLATDGRLE
jgi:hypothetical protein